MAEPSAHHTYFKKKTERLHERVRRLKAADDLLSNWRLFLFLAGLTGSVTAYIYLNSVFFITIFVLFTGFFIYAARIQNRVVTHKKRFESWYAITEEQMARMQLKWDKIPLHRYPSQRLDQDDINLTGPKSLLHLIDTTVTEGGHALLADWLLDDHPNAEQARKRSEIIRELKPLHYFRDKLRLLVHFLVEDKSRIKTRGLQQWTHSHKHLDRVRTVNSVLWGLALLNVTLLGLNLTGLIPAYWLLSLIAYIIIFYQTRGLAGELFDESYKLEQGVETLFEILTYVEHYQPSGFPTLTKLLHPFQAGSSRPSDLFKRAKKIIFRASLTQKNPLVWLLLNAVIPWDFYFTLRLESFKKQLRPHLDSWLDALHRLEALQALANFGYLNPFYCSAELIPSTADAPLLQATQMGHPLLSEQEKVRNNFNIQNTGDISLITGSNMSGKSTFLRTVAINIKLAMAGAPVDASAFSMKPLRLFTCINISDSLSDGISYFYAEVRRLKSLLLLIKKENTYPVCYCIDEIFRGTNNRERLQGSRALIRELSTHPAVGLISTHDLELVQLEDEIKQLSNYHFREHIEGQKMVFDYKLKPGPSPTTNALKIMEMEGLPVE